jgi:FkbM family methyltransferase
MSLISFAQNQEDIMLWRALRQVRDGFYIDVGAADPSEWSVTRVFYEQGWHGINLEPNLSYFEPLHAARSRDINLPFGAGRESGQQTFYDVGGSGLSTFDRAIAERHKANGWTVTEKTVEILTLVEVCERHRPDGPIHFLKIDVEGTEADVLAGADFTRFRPWIVLVEAAEPLSQEASHAEWEPLLTGHAYTFVWYDGLNRFYVADEMRALMEDHFRVQPNVFDDFVPAPALLARAERAEASLHQTNATAQAAHDTTASMRQIGVAMHQVSEAVRQTSIAFADLSGQVADAHRQIAEREGQLADARRQHAGLTRSLEQAETDAVNMNQRLHRSQFSLEQTERRAEAAEATLNALLASRSWRVTAPYRYAGRLLKRQRAHVNIQAQTDPLGKEIARQVFHLGTGVLLRVPGVRRCVRFFYSFVPGPLEFLALRYRAYEQRVTVWPVSQPLSEAVGVKAPVLTLFHDGTGLPDLSEDEARSYRQFVSRRSSATMPPAMA